MYASERTRVIPTGGGPKRRQKGNPKRVVTFRAPEDVDDFLTLAKEGGQDQTDIVVKAIRVSRDAAAEMGPEWWEVEKRANVEGVPIGKMLARLALAGLKGSKRS